MAASEAEIGGLSYRLTRVAHSITRVNGGKGAAARFDDSSGIKAQILPVRTGDDLNTLRQTVHE